MTTLTSNLATTQAIYGAFGKGDIPAILGTLSEDVSWEPWDDNSAQKAGVPWLQPGKGAAAVVNFFQQVGALELHDFQVLGFLEGGDSVAVRVAIEFTVPSTGRRMRDEEFHLWSFSPEGKVASMRHYVDTAKHAWAADVTASRDS